MAKRAASHAGGVTGVSHIGIAVRSIDSTLGFYEGVLGLTCEHIEEVAPKKVRAAFLRAGSTRVELIEPTDPTSTVARFLQRRGEGLHHLAFEVEGISAALARASKQGIDLVDKAPRAGARGCMVAFLHPASCHGVLVEFVEERPAGKSPKRSP
jgi:methylmalonyl-CoA/ethylmalonyl-CoA epimerase